MSVDRKEIDLIIRAALQGGQTLEGVTKSILSIEKALDAQTAAAKRGEASIDELKATLLALQRAQDQLKNQAGLIGQFQRLSDQITASSEKVSKSAKSFTDYKEKLDKAGSATEAQSNKLIKLGATAERNAATLARQRADQEGLTATLKAAGIEVDNLGAAEDRARQAAAQLGITINRTQQAISTYAEDVRKARDAEKALADEKVFQQKLDDAARLNKAGEYVRFWTDALNAADVSEKQVQINAALRRTADEAVAAARGYKTLGDATLSMSGPQSSLRQVIQGILDPAAQARTSLSGVEAEVQKVGAAVAAIKGPISDYRGQVQQLIAAQKAIAQQAGLVDSFTQQLAALRQARSEFVSARANVLKYAEALRNSTGENDKLQTSLRAAQATLAAAQKNLQAQVIATRELRDSMRAAGLATNDLATTQSRLTGSAQGATNALQGLKAAHAKYGDEVKDNVNAHDLFSNSGRTTLSFLQRIRGEVLSLVAAYAGLYGAIAGANSSIDAFNTKQGIINQLALSVGNDNAAIAAEYRYIHEQADRIGISFEQAAKGYAKFSAAAKLAGRDSKEIRFIFETFSEVGRVANLSKDDLDGVFRALEQIISKGTIQAEELRGQLGDRLFGAFQIAAQALKDQFPDLNKAMKDGLVTSEQLIKIAEKYREIVGPRLGEATQTLAANQDRLNTALFDFKNLVAEQGFATEYAKLVDTLTTFFKSSDGTKFAKDLSDGLSIVVQGLRWIVENLEVVKGALTIALGIYGSKLVIGLGAGAVQAAEKFTALKAALESTTTVGGKLMKGFLVLNAFFIGWEIGTILREKFATVRLLGVALVVGFETLWTRLKYSTMIIWAELPNIILDSLAGVGNVATSLIRNILAAFSAAARGLGKNDLADSIDRAIRSIEFRTGRIGNASDKLRSQMTADLEAIRKIGNQMAEEALNPGGSGESGKPKVGATARPELGGGRVKADEKRIKLKQEIEDELKAIDARIEKQEKDSLDSRLAALDDSYAKLIRKITKLGGTEGAALARQLTSDIDQLKTQETKKFNDALLKEQTELQRKLEQIDAAANRGDKTDLDRRLDAVKLAHEQTYRDIADLRKKLVDNNRDTAPADLAQGRLDAGIKQLQNIERLKFYEDSINALLEERKAKLDVIAVQEKTGLITATQARERAAEVVSKSQPQIDDLVKAGLRYVDVMIQAAEAIGASTTALEALKAKLIEAQESGKGLRTQLISAAQVNEMLANGAVSAFGTLAEKIGGAIVGLNSWKDVVVAARQAFLHFAADFLMEIGKMILKQALLNALQNATKGSDGGIGGVISSAVGAILKHDGGIVGPNGRQRPAMAEWFTNAPRFHGGGIPGLAADEYPAILKKNEEVLTQSDPRNVLNGGKTGRTAASSQNLKIINMIDSGSVVSEGLSSQEGERAFFNFIRANRTGLKQILT